MRQRAICLCMILALWCTAAWAESNHLRDVDVTRALYEAGKFSEALTKATEILKHEDLHEPSRIELLRTAGLCAFHLNDLKSSERFFLEVLKRNPDYVIDPFAAPPSAVKLFDHTRSLYADELNLVRQELALKGEQDRRIALEREQQVREEELRRRRVDEMGRSVVVRSIDRQHIWLNFVPFGAGQFQQGRVAWGATFAIAEVIAGAASITAFWAIEGLYETQYLSWSDRLTANGSGRASLSVRVIPERNAARAATWELVKYVAGGAFYGLWGLGIADALIHHHGDVVTEKRESNPVVTPTARIDLYPLQSGAGAALTIVF